MVVSCDGSATLNGDEPKSGWGFTASLPFYDRLLDFCGPTILTSGDEAFVGATRHSNNVGEITALYFALNFISELLSSDTGSCLQLILQDSGIRQNVAGIPLRGGPQGLPAVTQADHFRHLLQSIRSLSIVIEFDSQYAADVVRRHIRARRNLSLVIRTRQIPDSIDHHITWTKVVSHTGAVLNDRADHLADCGANRLSSPLSSASTVSRWARASR